GGYAEVVPLDQRLGSDGLLTGDIVGDDGAQHLEFALVHSRPSLSCSAGRLALKRSKCQSNWMKQPAPGAEPGPWRQVAGGVYVCLAQPASVNLGLVVGSDSALVVDTGSSRGQGRLLRNAVKEVTDTPIQAAVATHW